jgi:hypothetical protein
MKTSHTRGVNEGTGFVVWSCTTRAVLPRSKFVPEHCSAESNQLISVRLVQTKFRTELFMPCWRTSPGDC